MDKLVRYREIIKKSLENYIGLTNSTLDSTENVETQLLIDSKHDHYQVILVGWENRKRVYSPIFHLDIKNEKIWVQQNVSDFDLIQEIMDEGIPQTDIVLAFQSKLLREYSGFAVA
jgi:hypothetical protein